MNGHNPIRVSRIFNYVTKNVGFATTSYPMVSESLFAATSNVLQPASKASQRQCGIIMVTTLTKPADWLMAPCKEINDPGAFLCRIKSKKTYTQIFPSDISVSNYNILKLNIICPNGWTLFDTCINIQVHTENINAACGNRGQNYVGNKNTAGKIEEWFSHFTTHSGFYCSAIQMDFPNSGSKILFRNQHSQLNRTCVLCSTEPQSVTACPHGLFQCKDKSCISPGAKCDGKWDCMNGDDESECDITMCHINNKYQNQSFCQTKCSIQKHMCLCGLGFWQCQSGGCIALSKFCDYQQDCQDASDEKCPVMQCDVGQVRCRNGECINVRELFDLQRHCLDNSDEQDLEHENRYATKYCTNLDHHNNMLTKPASISKKSAHYVPLVRVNDFIPDCPYGSDEPDYFAIVHSKNKSTDIHCPPYEMPCMRDHPKCFPQDKFCVYEIDLEDEMLHCRNGRHVQNCKNFTCTQTFKCPASYCIPLHYVCDGKIHCPDGEEEHFCNVTFTSVCHVNDLSRIHEVLPPYVHHSIIDGVCFHAIVPQYDTMTRALSNQLTCSGMFRCQFGQCLHPTLLCDGIVHCPLFADDETSCIQDTCPDACSCMGKAVYCFGKEHFQLPGLSNDIYLLVIRHTAIREIDLSSCKYLLTLDLSFNEIDFISSNSFHALDKLYHINLAHNRLTEPPKLAALIQLVLLNISSNVVRFLPRGFFDYTPHLKFLDLSDNELHYLEAEVFGSVHILNIFSLGGNDIKRFDSKLLRYFTEIDILYTDKYQHCCLVAKVGRCASTDDGFSTCESLLPKPSMKVTVYIIGFVGIAANIYVIANRIKYRKSHSELIVNLAISDALYSVYLTAIASMDFYFSGAYMLFDEMWRKSFLCQSLSFLSLLSSQLSIVILTCIGIERHVAISNITNMRLHSAKHLPWLMLPVSWGVALYLSFLPVFLDWFYKVPHSVTSSICTFLDMSTKSAYKSIYFISVYVFGHGLCFLLIVILYIHIIYINFQSSSRVGRQVNLTLFKRTVLIVATNFLCWAPLTVFILYAYYGISLHRNVTTWIAIIVLSLNSAANPVLYTLSDVHNNRPRL